jgi:hypothetical protein
MTTLQSAPQWLDTLSGIDLSRLAEALGSAVFWPKGPLSPLWFDLAFLSPLQFDLMASSNLWVNLVVLLPPRFLDHISWG